MRTTWILTLTVALGGALAACPVVADDQPAAAKAAAQDKGAKLGDEVTCATDGMKMRLTADMPTAEIDGKTYYFCSESEKRAFVSDPAHKPKN